MLFKHKMNRKPHDVDVEYTIPMNIIKTTNHSIISPNQFENHPRYDVFDSTDQSHTLVISLTDKSLNEIGLEANSLWIYSIRSGLIHGNKLTGGWFSAKCGVDLAQGAVSKREPICILN